MSRALVALILAAGMHAIPAMAATIVVNTTDDEMTIDGDCSLREAIRSADTDLASDACVVGSGTDRIEVPPGTYALTFPPSATLRVRSSVEIVGTGPEPSVLDATGRQERIFVIAPSNGAVPLVAPAHISVALTNLELTGGYALAQEGGAILTQWTTVGGINYRAKVSIDRCVFRNNRAVAGGAIQGTERLFIRRSLFTMNEAVAGAGALFIQAPTTIEDTTFEQNRITNGDANTLGGGAIFVEAPSVVIRRTTILDNDAGAASGGGIACQHSSLRIENSTISSNTGSGQGGGGMIQGLNDENHCFVTIDSSTISANAGNRGGGYHVEAGGATFLNTIVAGNTSSGSGPDVSGSFLTEGHNLIGNGSAAVGFDAPTDIVGTGASPIDAQLELVADNGGATLTHVPTAGSPAVDSGACSVSVDQRGYARPPVGCDRGSVEVEASAGCPEVPQTGCAAAERSAFSLRVAGGARDKLSFSFTGNDADAATQAIFGDPTTADRFLLCVYDAGGGGDVLRMSAQIAAGSAWSTAGDKGYVYKDKAGSAGGITGAKMSAGGGDPGVVKIKLKGAGEALGDPVPPALVLPLRVQFGREGGACWEDTYVTAISNGDVGVKAKR